MLAKRVIVVIIQQIATTAVVVAEDIPAMLANSHLLALTKIQPVVRTIIVGEATAEQEPSNIIITILRLVTGRIISIEQVIAVVVEHIVAAMVGIMPIPLATGRILLAKPVVIKQGIIRTIVKEPS